MRTFSALAAGLLFGVGLAMSGMLNPVRVLGFLDVAGAWDPTLAFVLGGAVAVSAAGYQVARRRQHPAFAARFDIPAGRHIDAPLLAGAAIFGVGWGLAGFCPGPALASLSLGLPKSVGFVAAMLLGMALHGALTRRRSGTHQPAGSAA
jgi:uncharacterized membrane protein YedE/YeeE